MFTFIVSGENVYLSVCLSCKQKDRETKNDGVSQCGEILILGKLRTVDTSLFVLFSVYIFPKQSQHRKFKYMV